MPPIEKNVTSTLLWKIILIKFKNNAYIIEVKWYEIDTTKLLEENMRAMTLNQGR